ncbi:GyrI-like domain-containing protein [Paenibacillus sp. P26]|nr:GyrI-like domain-containing protein [Paenibacillus sp. P26]UUZ92516.1 GyrI-like domain-containing protein [Paenibacillus sp. P25]
MFQLIQERRITKMSSFRFIGRAATTTNDAEMRGEGVIPSEWGRLYQERTLERVPNKANANVLALYTDYESDEKGSYTFALGAGVTEAGEIPDGMKIFTIPESDYVVFTTRRGPVHEIVVEAWQHIWEWSRTNRRAFLTDFELYDERCADPANSQVDIYISVV